MREPTETELRAARALWKRDAAVPKFLEMVYGRTDITWKQVWELYKQGRLHESAALVYVERARDVIRAIRHMPTVEMVDAGEMAIRNCGAKSASWEAWEAMIDAASPEVGAKQSVALEIGPATTINSVKTCLSALEKAERACLLALEQGSIADLADAGRHYLSASQKIRESILSSGSPPMERE